MNKKLSIDYFLTFNVVIHQLYDLSVTRSNFTGADKGNVSADVLLSVSLPVISDACPHLCGQALVLRIVTLWPHKPHILPTAALPNSNCDAFLQVKLHPQLEYSVKVCF